MAGKFWDQDVEELNERLFETSVFVSKLLLAGFVFHLILHANPSTYQIQAAFASFMTSLLSIGGLEVSSVGIRIFTDNAVYVIVQDCLGWKSLAVFLGLMYASTDRTLEHLNFILLGLVALIAANVARVFSTVYLAEIGLISFEVIHGVLWRWSLTVVVLGLWIYWFKDLKDRNRFEARIQSQVEELNSQ